METTIQQQTFHRPFRKITILKDYEKRIGHKGYIIILRKGYFWAGR